ncbi:acyl-CoA thioester hydrolase [Paraburkholderia sp. BL18I3N2]|uniref:acyl-CoA thioesterase n=1 Tax=unclassified Paraburkholderia TaxID=2615204 RepID=UPI000D07E939|nr:MULTISPECIES: thioesterase family protein [unclassified Paraburkholderia]PRX18828.1 acyl-CoA thioester hydrolase [Paraburkholderia sp. BL18I3N2]PRX87875.1 acyl-CoA thioester hydrolase [Paraburkholderia sp. BL25I1N1]
MKTTNFQHCLRVRYHETDQQGIVYHARYLEYLDVAMTEYFRHLGWDYKPLLAEGCDPSIVSIMLEFESPASFEEEIKIAVHPVKVGSSSFTLGFDITRASGDEKLLGAETVYVNFDPATRRSRPLPPTVRERLLENIVANNLESNR